MKPNHRVTNSTTNMMRTSRLVAPAALTLAMASSPACSGDGAPAGGVTAQPDSNDPSDNYGLTIYVQGTSGKKAMRVGPTPNGNAATPRNQEPTGPNLKPSAVVNVDGEQVSTQAAPWILLSGAAAECGVTPATKAATGGDVSNLITPPWFDNAAQFFIFRGDKTGTCDEILRMQEVLLCMADKLAEVAESPAPLEWTGTAGLMDTNYRGVWQIPPQSQQDRFIARDLAMYVLGHLTVFDAIAVDNPVYDLADPTDQSQTTCTNIYGKLATNETWTDTTLANVLSCSARPWLNCKLPAADETAPTTTNKATYADERLRYKTFILRSAARLISRITSDSVDADLAGAESRRARAGDPSTGAAEYWGLRPTKPRAALPTSQDGGDAGTVPSDREGGDPYNSLAHAVRSVAGRWEMGTSGASVDGRQFFGPDPMPGGSAALDALRLGYRRGVEIRSSMDQRDVLSNACALKPGRLIETSGIILPELQIENAEASVLKESISNQLIANAASDYGIPLAEFKSTTQAAAIKKIIGDSPSESIRSGLRTATSTYRLATSHGGDNLGSPPVVAGRTRPAADSPDITALNGIVLTKGLPSKEAVVDPVAAAGGILELSQASSDLAGDAYDKADSIEGNALFAFQDSYAMAQTLGRRLVMLADKGREINTATSSEIASAADAAVAETSEWAGHGRIVATSLQTAGGTPGSVDITLIGFRPEDFGVSTPSQIGDQVRLVWGTQSTAECAARLRSLCMEKPEDYMAKATSLPVTPTSLDGTAAEAIAQRRINGSYGSLVKLRFTRGTPLAFIPVYSAENSLNTGDDHLFIIQMHDPKMPARGKILGTLALHKGGTPSAIAVSENREKQLGRILGGASVSMHVGVEMRGPSFAGAYCLPDILQDEFIPVENELTSDGDGYETNWRHYLTLAKEASAKADELGQKLIDIGLQKDFRVEAAQEELAEVCGSYGMLNGVGANNGEVAASGNGTDTELAACLSDPEKDIVFLTEDQAAGNNAVSLRDVVRCDDYPEHPVCKKLDAHPPVSVTTAGLGLVQSYQYEPAQGCGLAYDGANSLLSVNGFDRWTLADISSRPFLTADHLTALTQNLRMVSARDGENQYEHWKLYYGSAVIMDTRLPDQLVASGEQKLDSKGEKILGGSRWPGCARPGVPDQHKCSFSDPSTLASKLDLLFNQSLHSLSKDGADEYEQMELIRWRVEGALWLMSSFAGRVPAGMFEKELPVAKYNNSSSSNMTSAVVLTIYGRAQFDDQGNLTTVNSNSVSDEDVNVFGKAVSRTSKTAYPMGSAEIPLFLRYLSHDPRYLRVKATNAAHLTSLSNGTTWNKTGHDISWVAQEMEGLKCSSDGKVPDYAGPGASDVAVGHEAEAFVSRRKSSANGGIEQEIGYSGGSEWDGTSIGLCPMPNPGAGTTMTVHSHAWSDSVDFGWTRWFDDYTQYGYYLQTDSNCGPAHRSVPFVSLRNQFLPYSKELRYNTGWGATWPVSYQSSSDVLPLFPLAGLDLGAKELYWAVFEEVHRGCYEKSEAWKNYSLESLSAYGDSEGGVWTERALLPRHCGPDKRMPAFVNSYAPPQACGAAAQLVQAIGLACELSDAGDPATVSEEPPRISTIEELPYLHKWVRGLATRSRRVLSLIYLENIPDRVVQDFKSGRVGSGSNDGLHGQTSLAMASELVKLRDRWRSVGENLDALADLLNAAVLSIDMAALEADASMKQYTLESLRIQMDRVQSANSAMAAWMPSLGTVGDGKLNSSFNPMSAAISTMNHMEMDGYRDQQMEVLGQLKDIAAKEKNNKVAQVLLRLHQDSMNLHSSIETALSDIQVSAVTLLSLASQLRQGEAQARYEVAKALGEPYYKDALGNPVSVPVNVVLRREADITSRRYRKALVQAKKLAYLARIAIEQRIGARLSTFKSTIGALDAPATWADDLCQITGVDYEKLRNYNSGANFSTDAGADVDQFNIAQFAGQYIGDYVSKLEQFVEYYNLAYPSQDGDDTTILSLRDDLLTTNGPCVNTSNLLYYSDDLEESDAVSDGAQMVVRGWRVNPCEAGETRCLRVFDGDALPGVGAGEPAGANQPPSAQVGGGVTWLREDDLSDAGAGGASGSAGAAGAGGSSGSAGAGGSGVGGSGGETGDVGGGSSGVSPVVPKAPPRSVYQTVSLQQDWYVLSWYSQARNHEGGIRNPSSARLVAAVYSEDWSQVLPEMPMVTTPHVVPCAPDLDGGIGNCSETELWSVREQQGFQIPAAGKYHIVFRADGSGDLMSAAVANVQLEKRPKGDNTAGSYFGTTSTLQYLSPDCKNKTATDVQSAFRYDSEKGYYELVKPIFLDTRSVVCFTESSTRKKFARDNYNFRHINVGLNLVGTGVHDCANSGTSSCYGSGFVEYTLEHDANRVDVLGWNGSTQTFDFGSVNINHGKALAAERYITLPLSSTDQGLLSQAGFEKTEFRGRPVEGSYKLRIWDSPALQWNRLEDVQIVLKYRYWSPVTK